jgi:hypothetical protein
VCPATPDSRGSPRRRDDALADVEALGGQQRLAGDGDASIRHAPAAPPMKVAETCRSVRAHDARIVPPRPERHGQAEELLEAGDGGFEGRLPPRRGGWR